MARRRWVPTTVRVSPQGRWALIVIVGVMIAALNTGHNLLYMMLAILLALMIVHGLIAEPNLRQVQVERVLPAEIFAGQPIEGAIRVRNRRRLMGTTLLRIAEAAPGEVDAPFARGGIVAALLRRAPASDPSAPSGEALSVYVPPGGEALVPMRWTFPARGPARLEGLRLSSTFPFGLFQRSLARPAPAEVVVYPTPLPPGPEERAALRGGAEREGDRPGGAGSVLGLRPYRPGDPVRQIHWPTSARSEEPILVQRSRLGDDEAVVRLSAGPLEPAIGRACGATLAHLGAGRSVGLVLGDDHIAPDRGAAHRRRLLGALALHGLQPPADEADAPGEVGG